MKTKLELKDLSGYFPYSLICEFNNRKTLNIKIKKVHEIRVERDCEFVVKEAINCFALDLIKPILRPLSDIYKTIIHNEKEIIPIVELAKIAKSELKWKNEKNGASSGLWFFEFFENSFELSFSHMPKFTNNQYQLFDYLHELKIDYRGLIESGLAISVYDLEENPYK